MNRKEAAEIAPIFNAFVAGREIEFYNSMLESWVPVVEAVFGHGADCYRIVPDKIEVHGLVCIKDNPPYKKGELESYYRGYNPEYWKEFNVSVEE